MLFGNPAIQQLFASFKQLDPSFEGFIKSFTKVDLKKFNKYVSKFAGADFLSLPLRD